MRRGGGRARQRKHDPAIGRVLEVEVERIGNSGDGLVRHENKPVYVPLALPGDRLTVRLAAKRGDGYAAELVEANDLMPRRQPDCRHFGDCGGCRLQHLPMAAYRAWKSDKIEAALRSRGIEGVVLHPMIDGALGTRRRLRLAFVGSGDQIVLGHRRRGRREIVPIVECPIARPAITAFIDPLRETLATLDLAKRGGELAITETESGLDLLIDAPIAPTLGDREALAALAEREDLARVTWRPDAGSEAEPIAARREVTIHFGEVTVSLPPGAFLQATKAAERAIVKAVAEAVEGQEHVADLFSGCGAIGLPLTEKGGQINAFEQDLAMVSALSAAARRAGLSSRIGAESRDLDREPLDGSALRGLDAVILDPPRAGARAQVEAIAAAKAPSRVVLVSCNPATFGRDARLLIDAGYRLDWVQPIDAFLYAAEIELVAAFTRAKAP